MTEVADLSNLRAEWGTHWTHAINAWGRFIRLSDPKLCISTEEAAEIGLTDAIAAIRFADHAVMVDLPKVTELQLQAYPVEVLAHEVGHHVLCPGDAVDAARMHARIAMGLGTMQPEIVSFVGNIYADQLINDHLQRFADLRMDVVYQHMNGSRAQGPLWMLYMRIYELLWGTGPGSLVIGKPTVTLEADALLGSRLMRAYSRNWMDGAYGYASLFAPYVPSREDNGWLDLRNAGVGTDPATVAAGIDINGPVTGVHPAFDPNVVGGANPDEASAEGEDGSSTRQSTGQSIEPFELGEVLRSLGIRLDDHDSAVVYYRQKAVRHLIPFPTSELTPSTEPQAEGTEVWDIGSPVEDLDWLESMRVSPHVIPGVTTVQRVWGTVEGAEVNRAPVDIDLYVDSSGSMVDPRKRLSYPALAGAIIALSALRVSARVQVTLWSGAHEFTSTPGFITDETQILRGLPA